MTSIQVLETLSKAPSELGFGLYFTPEMVISSFQKGEWGPCQTIKTADMSLNPASKVLHYAQEIFEGLKAYRTSEGKIQLFRPRDNIRRMSRSAEIMSMPVFPEDKFLQSMKELVRRSQKLVPQEPGSLYLRPTMIGTTPTLGVAPANDYLFFLLASPSGGYFGDLKPGVPATISVWISPTHVRAVRGGLGEAKTGANYAASLSGVRESKKRGFNNVLFLDAIERRYIEELSGMNLFVVHKGVLKTPPYGDTILRGVTRDSILRLAQANKLEASEEPIDVETLVKGVQTGDISEVFACGTGASITAITEIGWKDSRLKVGSANQPGPLTTQLYKHLTDILYGRREPLDSNWIEIC